LSGIKPMQGRLDRKSFVAHLGNPFAGFAGKRHNEVSG
jgi:hypothetical protein